jgi:FAD/FMN-containing dehydrogenase
VLEQLSRVRKDNAGLPVRQLFIGSEGTLGVITRIVVALVPTSGMRHAAFAVVADIDSAVRVMRSIEARPRATLVAAELMSGNHIAVTARTLGVSQLADTPASAFGLLVAVAGNDGDVARDELEHALAGAADDGLLLDCVLPKNAAEERDLWRVREDWAVDRTYPGGLWYDVSVPIDGLHGYLVALAARIRDHDPALAIYVVGHLGDGNVHVTVNAAHPLTGRYDEIAPLVYDGLRELGGSFSAEHGIGVEKLHSLEEWTGPVGTSLMHAIKGLFDPTGVLNPGKVLSRGAA